MKFRASYFSIFVPGTGGKSTVAVVAATSVGVSIWVAGFGNP